MKKIRKLFKSVVTFSIVGSVTGLSAISPILAETQKPYKDVYYDSNIVSDKDWDKTDIGEYPISIDSKEWTDLSSMEASVACDMPDEYAEGLTTEELVDYAVNYPFLMDVLAFDKLENGMAHLENNSGVFKELFSRLDATEKLIDEYKNMEVNYEAVANGNASSTDYDTQMFIEEYMGLNYESLSQNESSEFVEAYGEKYEEMSASLEDSSLTTIFYECIEESMGEIPEDAIPDSVEEDIIASTDIGGASFTKISSSNCGTCGQNQDYGSITVNSKIVYAYMWTSGGYSDADIKNLDKYIADHYTSFSKISSASGKYNCHSYAWYSQSSTNKYWINNPENIYNNTNYWTPWIIPMRTIKSGDRITFWSSNSLQHSAVVNSSTQCTSKLGHYGMYKTTISAMIGFYQANTTKEFIPK